SNRDIGWSYPLKYFLIIKLVAVNMVNLTLYYVTDISEVSATRVCHGQQNNLALNSPSPGHIIGELCCFCGNRKAAIGSINSRNVMRFRPKMCLLIPSAGYLSSKVGVWSATCRQ